MNDVGQWLERLGLGQYAAVFAANDIDSEVLPHLTEQDLEKLGVSLGHRKKLLRAIASLALHRAEADASTSGERRQLTVMFCDLVGSTALSTRLDVEDLGEVIQAFQRSCTESIELFEGHVAKYMGDGILAYFGYPRAQEDDAERAVRAGLALVHAVGGLDVDHQIRLHVRVGIATGPVVVGQLVGEGAARETVVVGETPNLAARLQSLAAPDTVVIGPMTQRLVAGVFDCEDLGRRKLKGFEGPVRVWRVAGESSAEGRFAARKAEGLVPLVGRERELGLLLDWWRQSKSGHGQVALVRGEAGIGKSRLVQELEGGLEDQRHVSLRYHCSPHHRNTALHPVIDQLKRIAGIIPDDPPERKLACIEELLARSTVAVRESVSLLAALLSIPTDGCYPPLELAPRRRKERTLKALAEHVESLADSDPVLLLFEDVHWIDPTSLELLELLVDRLARLSVLAVVTSRPEFRASWADRSHVAEINLDRLSRTESARVARTLSRKALPGEVLDRIVARTDGIPLFVEELTKAVLETKLAGRSAGREASDRTVVPATLSDSLLARLDHLGSAKGIAQVAACVGREFSYGVLLAVTQLPRDEVENALARLVAAGLVVHGSGRTATGYAFKHALLRDAAYGTLLHSKRERIHMRIGEVLESMPGDHQDELAGIIGHHFELAKVNWKAALYFQRAGDRAAANFANAEALAFYEAALAQVELLPEQPLGPLEAAPIDLRERIGDVHGVVGHHEEARAAYRAALIACAEPARERRSRLYRKIGQTWTRQRQHHDQALAAYAEAEAALGSQPPERAGGWRQEWLQVQLDRLMALYLGNQTSEIERLIERVGPLVEQYGSLAQKGQFYQGVVSAAYRRDRYVISDEALSAAQASLDAYHKIGTPSEQQCLVQFMVGFSHLWRGEFGEAEASMREALALAERIGDVSDRVLCLTYLTILYRKQGRLAEVRRHIRSSRAACDEARMPGYLAVADANEAWLAWRNGDLRGAQPKAETALRALRAWPLVYPFLWVALGPLFGIALARGDTEQAVHHARAMLQETQQLLPEPMRGRLDAAIGAWDAGLEALAKQELKRAMESMIGLGFL